MPADTALDSPPTETVAPPTARGAAPREQDWPAGMTTSIPVKTSRPPFQQRVRWALFALAHGLAAESPARRAMPDALAWRVRDPRPAGRGPAYPVRAPPKRLQARQHLGECVWLWRDSHCSPRAFPLPGQWKWR
jgi:hypothetical protein